MYDEKQAVFLAQPFASGWPDCFSVSAKHWFEDKLICLQFIKFAYPSPYPWKWSIDHLYVCTYVCTYIEYQLNHVRVQILSQFVCSIPEILIKLFRNGCQFQWLPWISRPGEITFYLLFDLLYNVLLWTWKLEMLFHFVKKSKPIRFQSGIDSKTYVYVYT